MPEPSEEPALTVPDPTPAPTPEPGRPSTLRKVGLGLVTATLIPVLLLVALELGLRLAGYGTPTAFFLPVEGRDDVLTTNPRFGWRFFPPELAREPVVGEMAAEKPDGTYRVFVLGGSAALGTPEPAFGFGRVFAVMLRESWPERDFEVVITAMAAVNSHVVRLVAEEAAEHDPDLFLVYLGNNEVVGPYGPGSVFGSATPRLWRVRAALAARSTRLGQLLQLASRAPRRALAGEGGVGPERWRGLEMFVDRRVPADDPRLDAVYGHLRANLRDVVEAGTGAGADVALSTVAVNLLDNPPFASRPPELTGGDLDAWEAALEEGNAAWSAGRFADAVGAYRAAVALDEGHAGLRYRLGRALLTLGRVDEARAHFRAARDLDTLRFRADGPVNQAIRQVAASMAGDTVHPVDAADLLAAAASTPGLPGDDQFYEHVHLRFAGNYLLARAFFSELLPTLEERLGPPTGEPPSLRRTAELLGLTADDRLAMAETIVAMTAGRPPFNGQLEAAERTAARRAEVRALRVEAAGPVAAAEALATDRAALEARPGDLLLRQGLAETLHRQGRPAEAAEQWRRLVERLPGVVEWRTALAFALADAGRLEAAEAELRRALELRPGAAEGWVNLGTVLERAGDLDAAGEQYRRALEADPGSRAALLNLARLLERRERPTEAAELYRRAEEIHPRSAAVHRALAESHERRGDAEAAIASYRRTLELDPNLAPVHNNLGQLLERRGEPAAAARRYAAATGADPGYALAWFNLADLLLTYGRAEEAIPAYRRGLVLDPGNEQARRNLDLALTSE